MNDQPLRLGFPVKVMGKPGLKSNDTRRWQKNPHLKTSLEYVSEILDYLARHKIGMYRPLVRPRALCDASRHAAVPRHGGRKRRGTRAVSYAGK